MAKIAFSKLNKIKSIPAIVKTFNEQEIEIKQYLPLEDKVTLMSDVIDQAGNGEEGFFNIVKLETYFRIEIIRAYTNINFTEKQLDDTTKLYDAIILNDIWAFVEDNIPINELDYIWSNILELAREITDYNHSALGIVKSLSETSSPKDIQNLIDELSKISNSEQIQNLLKALGEKV